MKLEMIIIEQYTIVIDLCQHEKLKKVRLYLE